MSDLYYSFSNMKAALDAATALKLQGFDKVYLDMPENNNSPNLCFPHRHNIHSLSATVCGSNSFLYNTGKIGLVVSDPCISGMSYAPSYDIQSRLVVPNASEADKSSIENIIMNYLENS